MVSSAGNPGLDDLNVRALTALLDALGEPEVLESRQWRQYRWSLDRRPRTPLNIYLTLGPPHAPARPHVLIGDPCSRPGETVRTLTLACDAEIEALVAEVRERMQCP